jgi:long-subunit fatty acid transport protein
MKARSPISLTAAALILGSAAASAQGLLSIQQGADFTDLPPVTITAAAGGGYDSIGYSSAALEDVDSAFLQGTVGVTYAKQSEISPYMIDLTGGVVQYLDDADNQTNYSGRLTANVTYNITPRLTISDNFFLTYEVEPNFGFGGSSTNRRNGQYLFGYNNLNVSYAWSERFSTVTSHTIDGIKYDDSTIGSQEDRFSHILSQQFRYSLSERNKAVLEYRYRTTMYDRQGADFHSHFFLAGIDRAWSERSTVGFRAGAEMYSSDRQDKTAPYFEATLGHQVSDKTTLNGYASVGYDGAELGNFASRYSYRTGVAARHSVSEKLRLNGGLDFIHSRFDGQEGGPTGFNENQINATAGVGYSITDTIAVNANYSYTVINSGQDLRDYDRSRVFLGLSSSF